MGRGFSNGLLFGLALMVCALAPATASGAVVIGSNLANPPNANGTCGEPCTALELTTTPNPIASPVNGVITSWSSLGGSGTIGTYGTMRLRIMTPAAGGQFTATRSGPVTTIPTTSGHPLITTPVSPGLQISANDLVAVDLLDSASSLANRTTSGFSYALWLPPRADGTTSAPDVSFTDVREYQYQATIEPTNTLTQASVTRNKKKGTAKLTLGVPNAGQLAFSGSKVKIAQAANSGATTVAAAGQVTFSLKAKGKKLAKLNETGKVKVNPSFTFTPTNGKAGTQSFKVKLKKNV